MGGDRLLIAERIHSFFSVLRYHLRLILATFFIIAAALAIYIQRMPNIYQAKTQILVNPQRISDKYVSSLVTTDPSGRLNTLSQQILSASRLGDILDQFHLFPGLRDKMGRDELIDRMRKNIGIELKHNSEGLSAFTLSYTGDSPEEVAAVANKLAESFISWNLHDREQEAQGTTAFLGNELSETKSQLDGLEEQLRSYKMRHLGELPDQLQANMQRLARLQAELQANTEAQSRLDSQAFLAASLPAAGGSQPGAAPVLTERQKLTNQRNSAQAELAGLRKQYTDSFPDVIQKEAEIRALDEQIDATPSPGPAAAANSAPANSQLQLIRRDSARLVDEQRRIQTEMSRYQARVDSEPIREQEISQLLRDYDSARDHYRSLLERNYSAQMAAKLEKEQQGGSFTMLDYARVPDTPIGPKRAPLLIGALLLALASSIGVAFLSELLDTTVKSELELRDCIPGVPLLGLTPNVEKNRSLRRALAPTRYLLGGH